MGHKNKERRKTVREQLNKHVLSADNGRVLFNNKEVVIDEEMVKQKLNLTARKFGGKQKLHMPN